MDNGSTDHSSENAAKYHADKLRLIGSRTNLGFAADNNLTLKHLKADYMMLLNNDVTVDLDWLTEEQKL
jgi:hypothetical protein